MKYFAGSIATCCSFLVVCSSALLRAQQASGNDVGSAIAITLDQPLQLVGDRVTRPHVVYSISLPANQLFSMTITRLGPWNSMGFNPSLANAEVGDYAATGVLNCYIAVGGQYYLDFQFFNPGISLQAKSSVQEFHTVETSGRDISSAEAVVVGQEVFVIGDRVTNPHAVYSITLPANQLFSMTITRRGPWNSMGFDTVARVSLYAPGTQTVQINNPSLASAEVGDYVTTGVLNCYIAVAGQYYLDFQFFNSGISLSAVSSAQAFHIVQPSGRDISAAVPVDTGQQFFVIGDRVTKPHAVYSITLPANQLFSMTITRRGPWNSMGYDTVARVSLYAPGTQTVQINNPSLANAEVGDYAATGVLNCYIAVGGQYYLDFQFFNSGISLSADWNSPAAITAITADGTP
jgi:hypothetical protein